MAESSIPPVSSSVPEFDPNIIESFKEMGIDSDAFMVCCYFLLCPASRALTMLIPQELLQQAPADPVTGQIGPEEIVR